VGKTKILGRSKEEEDSKGKEVGGKSFIWDRGKCHVRAARMASLKRWMGIEAKLTALECYGAQSEHSREMDWIWESEEDRKGVFGDEMTVKCAEGD
jgi:hypothetical protein